MAQQAPSQHSDDALPHSSPSQDATTKPTENTDDHTPSIANPAEVVDQAANRVAQERYPRWRVIRRERAVLIGYIAYVVALAAIIVLGLAAHAYSVLPGDLPFTREIQESHNPVLYGFMYFISWIGYSPQVVLIEIGVIVLLAALRLRIEAIFVALTSLADTVGGLIKLLVGRHRPQASLVHVAVHLTGPSFPSGHTVHYTVFYGFILFILATSFRPSWGRNILIAVCVVLVVSIGLSRIYLGEHWLTDVLGGYLVGATCLVPIILGYRWTRARYIITSPFPWFHRRSETQQMMEKRLASQP